MIATLCIFAAVAAAVTGLVCEIGGDRVIAWLSLIQVPLWLITAKLYDGD